MDNNKTVLVTGATGAIGSAIARNIAAKPGYRVILIARDEKKAENTKKDIIHITGNQDVDYALVQLDDQESIFSFAGNWQDPVDVLVNNAAVTPRNRQENKEGIELQFATNVLGYFRMIKALTPHLKKGAPSRIVNVASYWAGGLDFDDLEYKNRPYDNDDAYRQSKQADRMLTVAFAERLKEFDISVNACHPGDVNSKLSNNLGYGGHESPDDGAKTPVWLATEPVGGENTGKYFEHQREVTCRFGSDKKAVEKLFAICESYTER